MALLPRPWALRDVVDVEALVGTILAKHVERYGGYLRRDVEDEAVAYLLGEAWRANLDFDASRGLSFPTFLSQRLKLRAVDWFRAHLGRTRWQFAGGTYERERREPVSLDGVDDRLEQALAALAGDHPADRDPDLARLVAGGDRRRARDRQVLGLEPNAGASE